MAALTANIRSGVAMYFSVPLEFIAHGTILMIFGEGERVSRFEDMKFSPLQSI